MSRRRGRSNQTSFFPFLAVLVSTMGALILLLLTINRQAQGRRLEAAKQQLMETTGASLPDLPEAEEYDDPDPLPPFELPPLEERPLADLPPLVDVSQPLLRRKGELAQKLADATASKATEPAARNDRLSALQRQLFELEKRLAEVKARGLDVGVEIRELEREAKQAERKKIEKQRQTKHIENRYAIVPYIGPNGTRRRPILLECRDAGITLLPEGVTVAPRLLVDDENPRNPLAAMLKALVDEMKSDGEDGEPYPLFLVRPDGIAGYYVGLKAISTLRLDFGYELLDDEIALDLPAADATIQELAQSAVRRALEDQSRQPNPPAQLALAGRGARGAEAGSVSELDEGGAFAPAGSDGALRGRGDGSTGGLGNGSLADYGSGKSLLDRAAEPLLAKGASPSVDRGDQPRDSGPRSDRGGGPLLGTSGGPVASAPNNPSPATIQNPTPQFTGGAAGHLRVGREKSGARYGESLARNDISPFAGLATNSARPAARSAPVANGQGGSRTGTASANPSESQGQGSDTIGAAEATVMQPTIGPAADQSIAGAGAGSAQFEPLANAPRANGARRSNGISSPRPAGFVEGQLGNEAGDGAALAGAPPVQLLVPENESALRRMARDGSRPQSLVGNDGSIASSSPGSGERTPPAADLGADPLESAPFGSFQSIVRDREERERREANRGRGERSLLDALDRVPGGVNAIPGGVEGIPGFRFPRRGVTRKILVECDGAGLVLHPGERRIAIDGPNVPNEVLSAIMHHVLEQREFWTVDGPIHRWKPALVFAIRPDGLENYARVRAAIAILQLPVSEIFVDDKIDYRSNFRNRL